MSEQPSTSRERIIPIRIEGEDDVINDDASEIHEKPSIKRILPMCNVQEKIILVVDGAEDENFTPFKLKNSQQNNPSDVLKRAVEMFLRQKSMISKKHEYALAVLNESSVVWRVDFTSNVEDLVNALHAVDSCETEDIFELNSLFDMIEQHVDVPEVCELDGTIIPPPYVVRTILFYGRSFTMPQVVNTEEIDKLLKSPYFTLDILITHEPVDADNNCNKIFETLQNLDQKGFAYFFPVGRDMKVLFSSIAKLLGHALQRPVQKNARYSIKEK